MLGFLSFDNYAVANTDMGNVASGDRSTWWTRADRSSRKADRLCYAIDPPDDPALQADRKSTRLNSSHVAISYAVFCLKKKKKKNEELYKEKKKKQKKSNKKKSQNH